MQALFELSPAAANELLKFIARRSGASDGGSFEAGQYEAIARAVTAVEQGSEQPFYLWVVCTWMAKYFEAREAARQAEKAAQCATPKREPFADVRAGRVDNPRYQMFLDSISQSEREQIQNNAPYFAWHADVSAEAARTGLTFDQVAALRVITKG